MSWETVHALSHALARTLLHFLWQGAAVGLVYLLALRWAGSPRRRHALALGGLLVILTLPPLTFLQLYGSGDTMAAAAAPAADGATAAPNVTAIASAAEAPESWTQVIVFAWLAGAMLIALRLLRDWLQLRAAIRAGSEPPPALLDVLERQMRRLGIRRRVRLCVTARITTAGVYGWLRPTILLPAALALCMPRDQLEALVAHELAHVLRADFIANSLALLARTLLYFHPVVHRICHDLESSREQLCDDLVVALDIDRLKYARALSTAESLRQRVKVPVPLLTATGGELSERVHRILDLDPPAHQGRERAPLVLALAAIALVMAGLSGNDAHRLLSVVRPEVQATYLMLTPRQAPGSISAPNLTFDLPRPRLPALPAAAMIDEATPAGAAAAGAAEAALAQPDLAAMDLPATPDTVAPVPESAATAAEDPPGSHALPEATIGTPAGGDRPARPRILRQVQPEYPRLARWDGIEGSVTLAYRINGAGEPHDIRVVSATPAGVFEEATIEALQRWRFAAGADGEYQQAFDFLLARNDGRCEPRMGSKICRPVFRQD